MAIDIFQFDWIFIDTVVIILLILFLVCVKIFKERFRWRSKLSNCALNLYKFDKKALELNNQGILIKNFSITVNDVVKSKSMSKPIVIIIRTNKNRKLFKALTEGLASYGYDVINIRLNNKSLQNQEEATPIITSILKFFIKKQLITNSNYLTIIHHKSKISCKSIVFDKNNVGVILINPKFDIINQKIITEIIDKKELISKMNIIFSKKSSTFLANKNLKEFLTYFSDYNTLKSKLLILEKSRSSFKYYETILLGIIINVIESNILKSQVLS